MRVLWVGFLCAIISPAQQTISAHNAASFSSAIAPGSILDVQQVQPPRIIDPDPSRVSVQVRPSGSTSVIQAPVIRGPFLSIWALLPTDLPLGPASVTLTVD